MDQADKRFHEQADRQELIADIPDLAQPVPAIQTEQIRQAKWAFNLGISIGIAGIVVLFAGMVLVAFFDKGVGPVFAGAIMDAISLFMIKFHRETNARLDEIRRDWQVMQLIRQIADPHERDLAIREWVTGLQGRGLAAGQPNT